MISNIFRLVLSSDVLERSRVKLVSVLFPEASLEGIEELVRTGMYPSRSAAVRASVRDLLKRELWQREREIPRKKVVRTRKRTSIRKKKNNQVL